MSPFTVKFLLLSCPINFHLVAISGGFLGGAPGNFGFYVFFHSVPMKFTNESPQNSYHLEFSCVACGGFFFCGVR